MTTTRIMVIRHAEKPGTYPRVEHDCETFTSVQTGTAFQGIEADGTPSDKSLVTRGWARAGALATLFTHPHGPSAGLSRPTKLFASDPCESHSKGSVADHSDQPSRRPYETITAVAAKLDLTIDASHKKDHYSAMVKHALAAGGVVLIAWQHQDIYWGPKPGEGIARCIYEQTNTDKDPKIPTQWPSNRYDLVWVFDIDPTTGQVAEFCQVPQLLLPGDSKNPIAP